ncbi:MAG TPA: hypothetical protein VN976_01630 [Verrucomicrobiae bacterium]|nr:hypothetical protein [Verrucomicrobiae bacterium]
MLGPVNYVIWLAILLAELFSLVCLVKKRAFSQHFTLVLYLCACIAADVASYSIIETSGYDSNAYFYFYFYSQSLLTICLYFVLMNLYAHVFSEMGVGNYIRAGAMLLLSGTAGISYYMVTASSNRLVTHFVVELGQNLYFVGVVLTYLLWGAMAKLHENRSRLMQLVLSMGVYVSLSAGSYALDNLYPNHGFWRYYFPITSMWLPLSWAYTFLKVPDDARIATARVLAPNR